MSRPLSCLVICCVLVSSTHFGDPVLEVMALFRSDIELLRSGRGLTDGLRFFQDLPAEAAGASWFAARMMPPVSCVDGSVAGEAGPDSVTMAMCILCL